MFGFLLDRGGILAWFWWYQTWLCTGVLPAVLIFYQQMSEDQLVSRCLQCSIQNRNVHISVLNWALWHMEQVHSGICELGQFRVVYFFSVVIDSTQSSFYKAVCEGRVAWLSQPSSYGALITERHSHSAAYLDKAIYVFGGCTPTSTTFNDLWRLDLSTRQWVRPLALGKAGNRAQPIVAFCCHMLT